MPNQEENIFLLIISIDVEFVGIISAAGLRNRAEHTVAFTSGDDSRIIVLILFQVAALYFLTVPEVAVASVLVERFQYHLPEGLVVMKILYPLDP